MKTVNIHEAKTHLSRLIERARTGEEITIAKDGRPVVKLVPVDSPSEPRQPGRWKGGLWISPDFDAPLPADLLDSFEGGA